MTTNEKNENFKRSRRKKKVNSEFLPDINNPKPIKSPALDFLPDIQKDKTKYPPVPPRPEVPMYDPQTGEPNPHYEELTGKKNPLLEQPFSPHEGKKIIEPNNYPRSSNENILIKTPILYEPKRKNRWILRFPEEMGIQSWVVSKTKRPSYRIVETKIFGFSVCNKKVWDEITIEFRDPIGPSTAQLLMGDFDAFKPFNYVLELLDPTGVVIEKWDVVGCQIKSVDFCELAYENHGIANIIMVIKPKEAILQF